MNSWFPPKRGVRRAFSLVEVVLALGIMAFALTTVLALLPLGVRSNQISAEESRAICILSTLEADLRNTHPLAQTPGNGGTAGRSALFGLLLPYKWDPVTGAYSYNNVTEALAEGITTVGLDEGEQVVDLSRRPPFQVSVFYTGIPAPGSLEAMQARLIVSWPGTAENPAGSLTDLSKVRGFVESYITFPAP